MGELHQNVEAARTISQPQRREDGLCWSAQDPALLHSGALGGRTCWVCVRFPDSEFYAVLSGSIRRLSSVWVDCGPIVALFQQEPTAVLEIFKR